MGVFRDDELIAGVVYHDWQPEAETIQISAAATVKNWTTREIIAKIWGYPFSFCQMAWAQTRPDNPARAIWQKLGAEVNVIPRLYGRNESGVICTLTDDAWKRSRYARLYNGKR